MNINSVNNVSFRARLSDSVKSHLTNKKFQKELEHEISYSETLRKFDAPDNEIVLRAERELDAFGVRDVYPRTILTGSINGIPIETQLNYAEQRWTVSNKDTYLKDLNSNKVHQETALRDLENTVGREIEIKSQRVRDYVEQVMQRLTDEEAAELYDRIMSGEFKL